MFGGGGNHIAVNHHRDMDTSQYYLENHRLHDC